MEALQLIHDVTCDLARRAAPALGGLARRLPEVYAADRLLLVASVAASAATAGAPALLAAVVRRGTALAVVAWLSRRRGGVTAGEGKGQRRSVR